MSVTAPKTSTASFGATDRIARPLRGRHEPRAWGACSTSGCMSVAVDDDDTNLTGCEAAGGTELNELGAAGPVAAGSRSLHSRICDTL